ncbi:cation transporter [Paraferrimonas haliotis]|uniref:Cobalt-zinc-cadmium resistance protein n=1 Tax=Paraferrimonas haliotis TaxID=2013866 RepID=A0AA37WYC7_9GAMM|nr:cation transporter [Paraferrimonas haliotis]GLS82896.1 cobalt-zinc-cadmium resistance protein [Paraferrimonas haliotis]
MSLSTQSHERNALVISCILAGMFAVGGVIIGWWLGSYVIAFDGFYSSVSLGLTLLSLIAAKAIRGNRNKQFPNGKAVLEPLVIAIKGVAILTVVAISFVSACNALMQGPSPMQLDIAGLFGVVNILGCGIAWWLLLKMNNAHSTGLIEAEIKQWKMDTWLSVAVTAGFLCAWLMTMTPWAHYANYADPLMMIMIAGYFVSVPLAMIRDAMRELLGMSSQPELVSKVSACIKRHPMAAQVKLAAVVKVGPELQVNLDINADHQDALKPKQLKRMKQSMLADLSELPFDIKLKLNLAL